MFYSSHDKVRNESNSVQWKKQQGVEGEKGLHKTTWTVIGITLILLIGVFYVLDSNQKQVKQGDMEQLHVKTHSFQKVLAYQSDYMGDASNISNLFNNLPFSDHKGTIELDSDTFTFIVNYDGTSDDKVVIYNTTAAFVLIKNLENVDMRFSDRSYVITRKQVEGWFGPDFEALIDPIVFKEKVQHPLLENNTSEWVIQ